MQNFEFKYLKSHFIDISEKQEQQFSKLSELYKFWNNQINVISRKDIDNLFIRHTLHSLAIAKVCNFADNSDILDVGTGGGFPGIPLAIMFPEVKFTLIDSIAKKIKVAQEVAKSLNLTNVEAKQIKSTQLKAKFDFITGRAVTAFPKFHNSVKHLIKTGKQKKGILYLKGGEFNEEIEKYKSIKVFDIKDFFDNEFYETKKIIYLPIK